MRERPPASRDTANPPAFYPSANSQQHIFTAGTQERSEEYTTPATSSASNTKELCDQREEVLHQGRGAVERQENTHVSSSFPNCPISSSSAFLSQEHNPDSIYRYYTQTRSPPALQPKLTFSLPPSWRDRPEDSVSDSGDVTSASGGGVVSEGDPVAVEIREVLVCVVEQLEGVVKRQTSRDGDSSEGKCISVYSSTAIMFLPSLYLPLFLSPFLPLSLHPSPLSLPSSFSPSLSLPTSIAPSFFPNLP